MKYRYDLDTYETREEAETAALTDLEENFENAVEDYFTFHPSRILEVFNELAHKGSPLYGEIIGEICDTYLEETVEEVNEND